MPITSVSIKSYGIFQDYQWKSHFSNTGQPERAFGRINVLYGRNYSGKTTLSRLFRSLETCALHANFTDCSFDFHLEDGSEINERSISNNHPELCCRVYSTDFIRDNLSWLHNEDGTIEPFTILGSVNIELEKKIQDISKRLGGNTPEEGGLIYEGSLLETEIKRYKAEADKKKGELEKSLSAQAKHMKDNFRNFVPATYSRTHLEREIPSAKNLPSISQQELADLNELLKESPLPNLHPLPSSNPKIKSFISEVNSLLERKIRPTQPIEELINDHILQEWVRKGTELHRGTRETCAFCGAEISEDLWQKIDEHFSKESDELRKAIQGLISALDDSRCSIADFLKLKESQFYSTCRKKFADLYGQWQTQSKNYIDLLESLKATLKKRENDIFTEIPAIQDLDNSKVICDILSEFNQQIEENNARTRNLSQEQNDAKNKLRLYEVKAFLDTSGYNEKKNDLDGIALKQARISEEFQKKSQEIQSLLEQKRQYEAQAKDESRGAELVNAHLSSFFGHDELKLIAEEGDENRVRFKITRQGQYAQNLSEGESSLISFCYFIAKIEDELKNEQIRDKLIIYIDDPISSLDSNHIFFMYSLIDAVIVKPMQFGQLFISTHNLDFLRYTKRLSVSGKGSQVQYFLVERRRNGLDSFAVITPMPYHLRDYATEFNYLFAKIHQVVNPSGHLDHDCYYNLPNNMRKFLECYLFYKFPGHKSDPIKNLDKLFSGRAASLIMRIVNEFSHLTHFDRARSPIDVAELKECAELILNKIEEIDPQQYESLVVSMNGN